MAFGADQFDMAALRERTKQRWSFFNLFYFSMGVALLMALTVVVYVQDNVGWGWGLGIPTIAMAVSVVVFVAGYPLYIRMKPGGSPLTRLAQVVVAAIRKRKVLVPADPGRLHQDAELDAVLSVTGRLVHTDQLRFFDRAAVVTQADDLTNEPIAIDLWRLSTVHRVEELKSVLRMLPIWVVGIINVMASSHNHSFAVQQARSMDRHLTPSFQIPPASMNVFSVATMLLTLTVYDRVFVPLARRVTGHPAGITCLQRMGIGFAIGIFANVAAALVETKRRATAAKSGLLDTPTTVVPISVFWLVPQYAIHGLSETFSSVGHLEFLYDQAPESMRSTAVALSWLANSMGNYLGTFLVTQVQRSTRNVNTAGWLQDNINRGNLDRYYGLVVTIQLINLIYYLLCAKFYTYKPLELAAGPPKVADDGGVKDVETAGARHAGAVSKNGREEEPKMEF